MCRPSSLLMSSLLKVRPGMRPRFFSQKMAQKLPLKKMPSIAAYATRRSAKEPELQQHTTAGHKVRECAALWTVSTLLRHELLLQVRLLRDPHEWCLQLVWLGIAPSSVQLPAALPPCLPVDPLDGPVCLLLDAGHSADGVEEAILLHRVLDVGLQQQTVHLCTGTRADVYSAHGEAASELLPAGPPHHR